MDFTTISNKGKEIVERLTQSLVDCYPENVTVYNNEYEAVSDNLEQLKKIKKIYFTGTGAFIYPDKNNDNIFTKEEFMTHLTKKVRKDCLKVEELEKKIIEGVELTAKEKKTMKTSYSGVRSGIAFRDIVRETNEDVKFVVCTRHPEKKVSVQNNKSPKNVLDIGSGVIVTIFSDNNDEILKEIVNKCSNCKENEYCLITSGPYTKRCDTSDKIKKLIFEKMELTDEVKAKVAKHLQPIRREAEKCCILSQRPDLMDDKVACFQGGNSDGLIFANGKFVADISVKDQDNDYILEQGKTF